MWTESWWFSTAAVIAVYALWICAAALLERLPVRATSYLACLLVFTIAVASGVAYTYALVSTADNHWANEQCLGPPYSAC